MFKTLHPKFDYNWKKHKILCGIHHKALVTVVNDNGSHGNQFTTVCVNDTNY